MLVQVCSVKSALIILFCQVCNVRGESEGGGGNNQRVKLDPHPEITGQTGGGSDAMSHGHASESDYTRYNQSLSSKTLSRLKRSSSNRDAKCELYFIEYVTSLQIDARQIVVSLPD